MNQEPDTEPVEAPDSEDAELLVVDPEDYNKTQRLKEIHRARENVLDVARDLPGRAPTKEHDEANYQIAKAVSMYVLELEPIVQEAIQHDALSEEDIQLTSDYDTKDHPHKDIFQFAFRFGQSNDGYPHRAVSMQVLRKANDLMRKLGLELELNPGDADQWEV